MGLDVFPNFGTLGPCPHLCSSRSQLCSKVCSDLSYSKSSQLGLKTLTCLNNLRGAPAAMAADIFGGRHWFHEFLGCKMLHLAARAFKFSTSSSAPSCSAARFAKRMFSAMVETQCAQATCDSLASKKKERNAFPVKDEGSCQPWGSAGEIMKAAGFRSSLRTDALCIRKLMQPLACPFFSEAVCSSNQRK